MNPQIKLVVSDLDGTLLNQHHQVSRYTKKVFQALERHGVSIIIASGRHYEDVCLIASQLALNSCLITSNGARLHNAKGEVLYENPIPAHFAEKVLEISVNFPVHRNIYRGKEWLVEAENEPLLAIHHSSGFQYQFGDFSSIALENIDKFYFNAPHEILVKLEVALSKALKQDVAITFTSDCYLEVMNKGVSKGSILNQVLKQRNLTSEQVMAFGDGFNDVEMLNLVGHGVVMQNANPKMKALVDFQAEADANTQDGVAHYLNQYFFEGQLK